jgi:hypothetical protein
MHQDKFVTVFFIERVPQYAFRQLYCHHQGFFLSELLHRPFLSYVITVSEYLLLPLHKIFCIISGIVNLLKVIKINSKIEWYI